MAVHSVRVRGRPEPVAVGKIVCIGRNYVDHISELHNARPAQPMFFLKPPTALCPLEAPIAIPPYSKQARHELELALLLGHTLKNCTPAEAPQAIAAFGVAIDVTLQDVQERCKAQGHPWEIAKSFDGSCPLSTFIPASEAPDPQDLHIRMRVNGQLRHNGSTRLMIWPIPQILAAASQYFTLEAGDVVLTGTPAGVGPLNPGDALEMEISGLGVHHSTVAPLP